MRFSDKITYCLCIFLAIALLITAGSQLNYINAQRKEMRLVSNEPLENAPPSLAFATVAMGAFRGLIVDILWIREENLKQKGLFFDAQQLAEWITALQPRFATVWETQAWNMAYNISVTIPANQPQERWRWVKNGYELLRDKGIPLNPRSILLYHELGYIFHHKIADVTDDAHKYYKLQLALEMQPLVEPGDKQFFEDLANSPKTWQQINADPNIVNFVNSLKAADPNFSSQQDIINNYISLRQNPNRYKPEAFDVIERYRNSETLKKFDIFAKAYCLREKWKMDPELMLEINDKYGPVEFNDPDNHLPLDWRHPECHAIYWAIKGLRAAGRPEEWSRDETNTDRIVIYALKNLFRSGKIFIYNLPPGQEKFDPQAYPVLDKEIYLRPDLRMFDVYNNALIAVKEKYIELGKKGSYESWNIGHRNMLKNAVLVFYQSGHRDKAQQIYNELRDTYQMDEFKVPLEEFARDRLIEEFENLGFRDATEMIQMLLIESYLRYALHDDDVAFGRENMAREVYQHYRQKKPQEDKTRRINIIDFQRLRYLALRDFLNDQQYPFNLRIALRNRIKLERPELAEIIEKQEKEFLQESMQ